MSDDVRPPPRSCRRRAHTHLRPRARAHLRTTHYVCIHLQDDDFEPPRSLRDAGLGPQRSQHDHGGGSSQARTTRTRRGGGSGDRARSGRPKRSRVDSSSAASSAANDEVLASPDVVDMLATLADGQKLQLNTTHQLMMDVRDLKDATQRGAGWSEGLQNRMVRLPTPHTLHSVYLSGLPTPHILHSVYLPES